MRHDDPVDTGGSIGLPPHVPLVEHVEQPQPVPVTVKLMIVQASPANLVRLELHSATGSSVYFLPADQSEQIGQAMAAAAKQAATGLIVANGALP